MTEELEVLRIITGRLESAGIGYMVTGSIAMNYYAVPRMTRDIDVVVELQGLTPIASALSSRATSTSIATPRGRPSPNGACST